MKKKFSLLTAIFIIALPDLLPAQTFYSITGKVINSSGIPLPGVHIQLAGLMSGTITEPDGSYRLTTQAIPPFVLKYSFVGMESVIRDITPALLSGNSTTAENVDVVMNDEAIMVQELVVGAARVEEKILESPVAIEKMNILHIQNTAADNYYKAIGNLKGVDMICSSINFQVINTRGFATTSNDRFVQLIDGMDSQAPALNFPIGNLNGPSELDVDNIELLPGASSALYGPNAFNGIILINSKNPFEYQGLSAYAKMGMNHLGNNADYNNPSPVLEGSIRFAQAFNNKLAFKVNFSYMKAEDWHGTSSLDREIVRTPTGFNFNPGADRLNYMGDEASINLSIFPFSWEWNIFASTSGNFYNNIFGPGITAKTYADAGDLPSHIVSVTPYRETDLIDYGAENIRGSTGIYYRIREKLELSALFNGGYGTSIYTGAQRYSLKNFGVTQARLQLRGDNFYIRAYSTMENSGDSYITEFLAKRVNDIAVSKANPLFTDVSGYLATYAAEYLRFLHDYGLAPGEVHTLPEAARIQVQQEAHDYARNKVDKGDLESGGIYRPMILDSLSKEFSQIKKIGMEGTVPDGPKFNDKTNMYHLDFQYDFKNEIDFLEMQAGGSYRLYDLNSNGTIFDDATKNVTITEVGAYVQAGKWLLDRHLKLTGSVRYDKNENFEGRINPRISAVVKPGELHNIRFSFQTGFRNPPVQGQHIDLNILSARLIGGLPRYADKYDIIRSSAVDMPLSYNGYSVEKFRNYFFNTFDLEGAVKLLEPVTDFRKVKPENISTFELGYRGVFGNNFSVDLSGYYNIYNDFIGESRIVTASEFTTDESEVKADPGRLSFNPDPALTGIPDYLSMLTSNAMVSRSDGTIRGNAVQIYSNSNQQVESYGVVTGMEYKVRKGYFINGNFNWNVLRNVPEGFVSLYNTPAYKLNLMAGKRDLTDKIGFNLTWRWQDEFKWASGFTLPANGMVPAFSTLDAQVSYKVKSFKSIIKLGGSDILNRKYNQSLGGPNISALYYVSITFDEFMN